MRVCYIAATNAAVDREHWSGTTHGLFKAMAAQCEIVPIRIAPRMSAIPRWQRFYFRLRRLKYGDYRLKFHPKALREMGERASRAADASGADVALCIHWRFLPFWRSSLPVCFFSDEIFGTQLDYYDEWRRDAVDARQIRELTHLTRAVLDTSSRIFITSEWALRRAEREIGVTIPWERVSVTLVGANISPPSAAQARLSPPPLRLLWVGVDWWRKGGYDCLMILEKLLEMGIDAELHVVGCSPPHWHPRMKRHGLLRQSVAHEREALVDLYSQCHLFLFPTEADLSSCVLAEAAAFGIPAIATPVGGIPELFSDDEVTFVEPDRFQRDVPGIILDLLKGDRLASVSALAKQRYQDRLNWDVIAARMIETMHALLAPPNDPGSQQSLTGRPKCR